MAGEKLAVVDRELRMLPLVLGVDVRHMVLISVEEVHPDQDAVEAADEGHRAIVQPCALRRQALLLG